MATILSHGAVTDGYDVRVLVGQRTYALHFASMPDSIQDVADAIIAQREAEEAARQADYSDAIDRLAAVSENAQAQAALTVLENAIEHPVIARALTLWPDVPEALREQARESAPTFARLLALGEAIP